MSELLRRDALYKAHVDRLQAATDSALHASNLPALLIHSGHAHRRTVWDDQDDPFRVLPWFAWWLPLTEPDVWLLLRPGEQPTLYWPELQSFWEKTPEPEAFWQPSFALERGAVATVRSRLLAAIPRGTVALVESDAMLASAGLPGVVRAGTELVQALEDVRVHKDAFEIAALTEASRRAAEGHEAIRQRFAAGAPVSELALLYDYLLASGQDEADAPYKTIVALDANAATLHHVHYDRTARAAGLLLVDGGASVYGYGADITRTWVSAHAPALLRALVEGVDRVQQHLCEGIRPGRPYEELHDEAHARLGALLRDLGIVRKTATGELPKPVSAAFFPHGIGHSLGIQTHDVGCRRVAPRADNPFLRNTRSIEVGQVFTVEPGVYFIPQLLQSLREGPHAGLVEWSAVEALLPFGGVRIEDNVVVTQNGHDNLTRALLPAGGGLA